MGKERIKEQRFCPNCSRKIGYKGIKCLYCGWEEKNADQEKSENTTKNEEKQRIAGQTSPLTVSQKRAGRKGCPSCKKTMDVPQDGREKEAPKQQESAERKRETATPKWKTVHCPNCQKVLRLLDAVVTTQCIHCKSTFQIPKVKKHEDISVDEKITFACPTCSHSLTVPRKFAGKKGKCPKCQKILLISEGHTPTRENKEEKLTFKEEPAAVYTQPLL